MYSNCIPPLQGSICLNWFFFTQGDALGYTIAPHWGEISDLTQTGQPLIAIRECFKTFVEMSSSKFTA